MQHKLTSSTWQRWRDESPDEAAQLRALVEANLDQVAPPVAVAVAVAA
ncbi:hypothetical protein ACLB90_18445 [Stenotrophomonas sp. LGBM10]